MGRNETKGTRQLATAIASELADRLRVYCQSRDESIRVVLERAITREMQNPPPPVIVPPLPPVTAAGDPLEPSKKPRKPKA